LEYSCRSTCPKNGSQFCDLACASHIAFTSWMESPLVSGTKTKTNRKARIVMQENKKNVTEVPNVAVKDRNVYATMKLEMYPVGYSCYSTTHACLAVSRSLN